MSPARELSFAQRLLRRSDVWRLCRFAVLLLLFACAATQPVRAQVSASITGVISDPSGAFVASARVVAHNTETGFERSTTTNGEGRYQFFGLPIGTYYVEANKDGFDPTRLSEIRLVVHQEALLNITFIVASNLTNIEVIGDAPMVSLTTRDISGLVGEEQVKDLPLNGRSYDLLLQLNPGVINFTSLKTGGTGISNSTTANNFVVSGNRPQQNIFLLNGVEYTGAAENNMTPGGTSGVLLGVDAVREFNVQRDTYGAEFGKRPGGQVVILTQSGSNNWHGSAYEFLRNNALDAPNFFDRGDAPPFQRNQFGGSVGGPLIERQNFFLRQLRRPAAKLAPDLRRFCARPRLTCSSCAQRAAPLEFVADAYCRVIPTSAASPKSSAARCKPFAKISAPYVSTTIFPLATRFPVSTPSTMATISPPPLPIPTAPTS